VDTVVTIGNKEIGKEKEVFIVAEIGINHNGDVEIAKRLIDVAVAAGADAVKFQKRTVPVVYTANELARPREVHGAVLRNGVRRGVFTEDAVSRLERSNFEDSTNGDLKWLLEFTHDEYAAIDEYCREKGILWFASCWDEASVDFIDVFDPPCYKIASPSLTDDALLRHTRSKGKPIILSTGMSDLAMIRHAVSVLGEDDLVIMHCTSYYATQSVDAGDHGLSLLNLRGMRTLSRTFPGVPIGFSSNDTGIMPTYAAVAMGACAIEKHLTLYRAMWGSDQEVSVEPDDFKRLCRAVREFSLVRGNGKIVIYDEEVPLIKKLRRK